MNTVTETTPAGAVDSFDWSPGSTLADALTCLSDWLWLAPIDEMSPTREVRGEDSLDDTRPEWAL